MLVELSRDGGGTFETLAAAAPNTGSFAWIVTGPARRQRSCASPATIPRRAAASAPRSPSSRRAGRDRPGRRRELGDRHARRRSPGRRTWRRRDTVRDRAQSRRRRHATRRSRPPRPTPAASPGPPPARPRAAAIVRVTSNGAVPASGVSGAFAIVEPDAGRHRARRRRRAGRSAPRRRSPGRPTCRPPTRCAIELSRNGGTSYSTLATAAPNSGSFAWTVAGAATTLGDRARLPRTARRRVAQQRQVLPGRGQRDGHVAQHGGHVAGGQRPRHHLDAQRRRRRAVQDRGQPQQRQHLVARHRGGPAAAPRRAATTGRSTSPRTTTARIRVTWTANTAVTDPSNVNFKIN